MGGELATVSAKHVQTTRPTRQAALPQQMQQPLAEARATQTEHALQLEPTASTGTRETPGAQTQQAASEEFKAKALEAAEKNPAFEDSEKLERAVRHAERAVNYYDIEKVLEELEKGTLAGIAAKARVSTMHERTNKGKKRISKKEFEQQARELAENNPDLKGDEERISRALDYAREIAEATGNRKALEALSKTLQQIGAVAGAARTNKRGYYREKHYGLREILEFKPGFSPEEYEEARRLLEYLELNYPEEANGEALEVLRACETLAEFRLAVKEELGARESRVQAGDAGVEAKQRTWRERTGRVLFDLVQAKFGMHAKGIYAAKSALENTVNACNGNWKQLEAVFELVDEARGPYSLMYKLNEMPGGSQALEEHEPAKRGKALQGDEASGSLETGEKAFLIRTLRLSREEAKEFAEGDEEAKRTVFKRLERMRSSAAGDSKALECIALLKERFSIGRHKTITRLARERKIRVHEANRLLSLTVYYLQDYKLNEEGEERKFKQTDKAMDILAKLIKEERKAQRAKGGRSRCFATDKATTGKNHPVRRLGRWGRVRTEYEEGRDENGRRELGAKTPRQQARARTPVQTLTSRRQPPTTAQQPQVQQQAEVQPLAQQTKSAQQPATTRDHAQANAQQQAEREPEELATAALQPLVQQQAEREQPTAEATDARQPTRETQGERRTLHTQAL
ncbi:hypothetical protein HY992_04375 [Candidatus Micrarchaeota archaeon]|nr:hypothetical protein [Candidatus Micrarchaeota archaeon]